MSALRHVHAGRFSPGEELAVVVRDGRPYGVISASDVRRALLIAQLGGTPDHSEPKYEETRQPCPHRPPRH
ncbi:hypothetical protein [Actinoplanes sp. NPDC049265]|uniref:hypothetical protein n=1 Tax=Actinoplanes sp. NPDC049265 TaxID=3363902 RepID=UPI003721B5C7